MHDDVCSGHLVIVNSSLQCGGAERVITILTQHWAEQGKAVSVLTIHSEADDHFALDSRVGRIALDAARVSSGLLDAVHNNWVRLRKLRQAIRSLRNPVIVSFQDTNNILCLIATTGLNVPVYVCERNDPRMRPISSARSLLRRVLYRFATAVVIQTESLRDWAQQNTRPERISVIPNPVLPPQTLAEDGRIERNVVLAVGRLVEQKGFDLLLEAFATCDDTWRLVIAGDGPDRAKLEEQAERLGISERVDLPGRVSDPALLYREASLFVLSSRYEGFPNVLLEAHVARTRRRQHRLPQRTR